MTSYTDYSETYADCYEFITQHKNYIAEVDMLLNFLANFEFDRKILSVGCGTGMHEVEIAKRGFMVFGMDKSEWMISHALSKSNNVSGLSFGMTYSEAGHYLGTPFGCVISLFNVINCLSDLSSLRNFFHEIYAQMKPGGVFFFEAWNGIECLRHPPETVGRDFEDSNGSFLSRKATPSLKTSSQYLEISYEINGFIQGRKVSIESLHGITLFTINEISYLLNSVGFKNVEIFSALPELEPFDLDSSHPPRMLSFCVIA